MAACSECVQPRPGCHCHQCFAYRKVCERLPAESDLRRTALNFTMIGATAGEVMAAVQTAMMAGLPYSRLANAALAHPTMAEGLSMLFSNTPPRSVQQIAPERAA